MVGKTSLRRPVVVLAWLFLMTLIVTVALTITRTAPAGASQAQLSPLPPTLGAGSPQRVATISDDLREQIGTAGSAQAVVTTWNRAGLDVVEALGVTGTRLQVLPMLLVESLTQAQLDRLARSPVVRSVYPNREYEVLMEESTWTTKARYVWASTNGKSGLPGLGVTGEGIELAVIDTGADGNHQDMDNLIQFCDVPPAGTPVTCVNDRHAAVDDEGHGSHVAGTVAGSGDASGGIDNPHSTIGMAPNAKLRAYSANIGLSLLVFQTLGAYDDMIARKLSGESNVIAVNNSWGGGTAANYPPDDPTSISIKTAYDAGIVSVFAAGNSGPEHNTLSDTCISPWAVCVAASTKPDQKVAFSSVGRPSQPSDTNRDGKIDGADVQPDNHDRALGQAYGVGVYRPTLIAPGVNIYSISANSAGCREGAGTNADCYEPLNGTSMATPHVTGAAGLIGEAFRDKHGRLPRAAELIDILERSANVNKLPGWEAEEQGNGRLDVYEAVKFARTYPKGLPRANVGFPTPPYAADSYPVGSAVTSNVAGCTGTGSWSTGVYGQHFVDVPAGAERLQIQMTWPSHPTANLYGLLWRPGVNPDDRTKPAGTDRVFPDQEATGLPTGAPPTRRLIDVRAPEESEAGNATSIPSGRWVLRVYHRVGGAPTTCGATAETPKRSEGFKYNLRVSISKVTATPTVAIDTRAPSVVASTRWARLKGEAGYPPDAKRGSAWEGITNWDAPGSSLRDAPSNYILYFHGNADEGCSGDGRADMLLCSGPMLLRKKQLDGVEAASWKGTGTEWVPDATNDRDLTDPSWVWCLKVGDECPKADREAPANGIRLQGTMQVEWWASCSPLCVLDAGDWQIRVFVDGQQVVSQQVTAGLALPNVPERLTATVQLPEVTVNQRLTLHIEPWYLIDQYTPFLIYYDSKSSCSPLVAAADAPNGCDSLVRLPVATGSGGAAEPTPVPQNVRVTDLPASKPSLRVAWDVVAGATYEVYRSSDPRELGKRVYVGDGVACMSPAAPAAAPDGHDRAGRCYADTSVSVRTPYYYRVFAVKNGQRSKGSELAYGVPTRYDRQVKLRVDRLYGPQYWEAALEKSSPDPSRDEHGTDWQFLWDTFELAPGSHGVRARSFTQGIGSEKAEPAAAKK